MKKRQTKGFTLIELLIVVAIIGIIAAIAVPGLLRARMAANEASAIGSMRAINTAQALFAATCGGGYFAFHLDDLGIPPYGTSAAFIAPDLRDYPETKGGYLYVMMPDYSLNPQYEMNSAVACNGIGMTTAYWALTLPVTAGVTGQRSFATNTSGTIFYSATGDVMFPATGLPTLP